MSGDIKTHKGKVVRHDHPKQEQGEMLEVSVKLCRALVLQIIKPEEFEEVEPPTRTYNCFGLAFGKRHGWIRAPEFIMAHDFGSLAGAPQNDDVVLYIKDTLLTHAALVHEVKDDQIVKVRSKWGEGGELIHRPEDVPSEYGIPAVFMRRTHETTIPDMLSPGTETKADEAGDEVLVEAISPSATSLEAAAEDEIGTLLMLASTDELRDRIIRQQAGVRGMAATTSVDDTSPFIESLAVESEVATEDETGTEDEPPPPPPALPPGVDPETINKQLTELLKDELHHRLAFASFPAVARKIIIELPPVKELTDIAKRADAASNAVGQATLKFFEDQLAAVGDDDEKKKFFDKLFSILFFILKNSPVKEAAPVLSNYILTRKPLGLSRTLAVEAFSAAAVI
jgi:hypothetical protein